MKILEQFICGKKGGEDSANYCEDGLEITPDFIAVIDGSTSKTASQIDPGMKNGRLCMLTVRKFISNMPADISLDDFCDGVTQAVHQLYGQHEDDAREHPVRRLCASAVVYSRQRKEIWMVGDCQCMVNGKRFDNGKPYEEIIAARRSAIFTTMLERHSDMVDEDGIIHDYARDAILPDLIAAMEGENSAYAVIDGFPIYRPGIRRIPLRSEVTPTQVVLASDGYPYLQPTLKASEESLSSILKSDPFLIHLYKATKGKMKGNVSFDDRTYIRFVTD